MLDLTYIVVTGGADDPKTPYRWDGKTFPSQAAAVLHGRTLPLGGLPFLGVLYSGRLGHVATLGGIANTNHDDTREIAADIGLPVAEPAAVAKTTYTARVLVAFRGVDWSDFDPASDDDLADLACGVVEALAGDLPGLEG